MPNRQPNQGVTLPPDLRPTQEQLSHLSDTVLAYEPRIGAFDGLPRRAILDEFDADLTDFEILAGPPRFDETMAPAQTLRTPDRRVIWLSVFRNPDNNAIVSESIRVLDPPVNRSVRDELPSEDYDITKSAMGKFAIVRFDSPPVSRIEVSALQLLIDSSKQFNGFLEV